MVYQNMGLLMELYGCPYKSVDKDDVQVTLPNAMRIQFYKQFIKWFVDTSKKLQDHEKELEFFFTADNKLLTDDEITELIQYYKDLVEKKQKKEAFLKNRL